jgi:hypothetical protein
MWFACDSGIPQPECVISMQGYRHNQVVASAKLTFPALPSGMTTDSFVMNFTTFAPEWAIVSSIEFSIATATGDDFNGALLVDDFVYLSACDTDETDD